MVEQINKSITEWDNQTCSHLLRNVRVWNNKDVAELCSLPHLLKKKTIEKQNETDEKYTGWSMDSLNALYKLTHSFIAWKSALRNSFQ